jgi:ribosomal protein L29
MKAIKMLLAWALPHRRCRSTAELPRELREASHRMANEGMKLRQGVVQEAGGIAAYERQAARINAIAREMRRGGADEHSAVGARGQ